jgi:hypothetical protein
MRKAQVLAIRRIWGKETSWYNQWTIGTYGNHIEDHKGQLTDATVQLFTTVTGPLQSNVELYLTRRKEFFDGVLYQDLDSIELFTNLQPSGALRLELFAAVADTIDYANNQPADELLLSPEIEAKIGRHLNASLDHTLQRLDVAGGQLFAANLSQIRLVYNFNLRLFVRGIFQWQHVERDPALYDLPVEPETEELFTQLLFSYKLNARTVLFLGYSDNQLGLQDVDLTRTDRTFFFKLGYAWIL